MHPKLFLNSILFLLFCLSHQHSYAQIGRTAKIDYYAEEYALKDLDDLMDFLSMPNHTHNKKQIIDNIEWCEAALAESNFIVHRIPTNGNPYLLAERNWVNPKHTILFYFQLDGVDPIQTEKHELNLNDSNNKPISNSSINLEDRVLSEIKSAYKKNWTIKTPPGGDTKAVIAMFASAQKAIKERYNRPRYNIKVLINTEGAKGSIHLEEIIKERKDELQADLMIAFEGIRLNSEEPLMQFDQQQLTASMTSWLKEGISAIYDSPPVVGQQLSMSEGLRLVNKLLEIPVVQFPLVNKEVLANEGQTKLQMAYYIEGIKTCMGILQLRF